MIGGRGGDAGRAIVNRQRGVKLAVAPLRKFLSSVCDGLGLAETELVICFVTDAEIARMNWAFRKKRGPTDVLSFPAVKQRTRRGGVGLPGRVSVGARNGDGAGNSGSAGGTGGALKGVATKAEEAGTKARPLQLQKQIQSQNRARYLGDIAIAPAVARRYAKKNGRSFAAELRVLMLHGVLHLLGYDHESDRGEMDRLEKRLRRRFGIA
jgi:rRNA maturation RNase YbeY